MQKSKKYDKNKLIDIGLCNSELKDLFHNRIMYTIKDNDGKSKKKLEKMKPLILDYLSLTLEEVFIYEMEALGYEFNKFV